MKNASKTSPIPGHSVGNEVSTGRIATQFAAVNRQLKLDGKAPLDPLIEEYSTTTYQMVHNMISPLIMGHVHELLLEAKDSKNPRILFSVPWGLANYHVAVKLLEQSKGTGIYGKYLSDKSLGFLPTPNETILTKILGSDTAKVAFIDKWIKPKAGQDIFVSSLGYGTNSQPIRALKRIFADVPLDIATGADSDFLGATFRGIRVAIDAGYETAEAKPIVKSYLQVTGQQRGVVSTAARAARSRQLDRVTKVIAQLRMGKWDFSARNQMKDGTLSLDGKPMSDESIIAHWAAEKKETMTLIDANGKPHGGIHRQALKDATETITVGTLTQLTDAKGKIVKQFGLFLDAYITDAIPKDTAANQKSPSVGATYQPLVLVTPRSRTRSPTRNRVNAVSSSSSSL